MHDFRCRIVRRIGCRDVFDLVEIYSPHNNAANAVSPNRGAHAGDIGAWYIMSNASKKAQNRVPTRLLKCEDIRVKIQDNQSGSHLADLQPEQYTVPPKVRKRRAGCCQHIVIFFLSLLASICLINVGVIGLGVYDDAQKVHLRETRTVKVFQPANTLPVQQDGGTADAGGGNTQPDEHIPDATTYEKWYRSHLSESDKQIYDQIEQSLRAQEQTIPMNLVSQDAMMRCYQYVINDNIDIFWADEGYEYMHYPSTGEIISIQPTYRFAPDERARKQESIDGVIAKAIADMEAAGIVIDGTSDYDKARFLYGWVADYLTYDDTMADFQNLADVCEQKVTACAGYTRLYELLCRKAEIGCVYVTGNAIVDDVAQLHAWSIMDLDGTLCYTDVTWGDKDGIRETDYSWLALTSEHISLTHTLDDPALGVEANDGKYEIWNVTGSAFSIYDAASVQSRLAQSIRDRWHSISLFFEDPIEYDKAYEEIAHSAYYPTVLSDMFPDMFPYAYTEGVYSVRKEIGLNVLTITWKY